MLLEHQRRATQGEDQKNSESDQGSLLFLVVRALDGNTNWLWNGILVGGR